MGLIMVRYGEIALKGGNQPIFVRRLRHNIRDCLKRHDIGGEVTSVHGRVYVETEQVEEAAQCLQKVFGIVSLSPAVSVAPNIEAIKEATQKLALEAGVSPQKSFRVRVRRADKSFPITSPEVSRLAGENIVDATSGRVDLSDNADVTIGVEIRQEGTRVFGETLPGPGGLPLNSSGRVVALISGGIDSPVAAWMMMKRGCGIVPVHFKQSDVEASKALDNCRMLSEWSYGWRIEPVVLEHECVFGGTVEALRRVGEERWTCVMCKRTLLLKAAEIAEEYGAHALVTGESVGQVASQTVENLEAISYGVPKPILRPLIGLDKVEIIDLARRIGSFDISTRDSAPCPYLPGNPLTRARMPEFKRVLAELGMEAEGESAGL